MEGEQSKKTKIRNIILPFVLCLIFCFICLIWIQRPITPKEAYFVHLSRESFGGIFPFILKIWSQLLGNTIISLRFLSVFSGAMSIIFFFQLAKKWLSPKGAVIASILFTLNPLLIIFGFTIHPFNLIVFSCVIILFLLSVLLKSKKSKIKQKSLLCLFGLALLIMIVCGLTEKITMQTTSPLTKIIPAITGISSDNECIILDQDQDFYSAEFYANDTHQVFSIDDVDFDTLQKNKIWFITSSDDNVKTYGDYNLPDQFDDYKIIFNINNDKIVALELEKTEN